MNTLFWIGIVMGVAAAIPENVSAQNSTAATQRIGGAQFEGWTGLKPVSAGANSPQHGTAELRVPGEAVYRVPDGPKGWVKVGLRQDNDSTIDARKWYGLRFDILLDRDTPFDAALTVAIPPQSGRHDLPASSSARLQVQGKGWHTVTVPFESFDYNRGQVYFLKFVKQFTIKGRYTGAPGSGGVLLHNVRLVRGNTIHLDCAIRSAPAAADGTVSYPVTVINCSDAPQSIALTLRRTGWEGMVAEVSPSSITLQPGQSRVATVRVTVPAGLPAGARETQTLVAAPNSNGGQVETMEFITLRRLSAPYLVLTEDGWEEVRVTVAKYDWAKKALADIIATADAFQVPVVPPGGIKSDQGTPGVFPAYIENKLWPCAVAWKLTGEKRYAEKVALFLRRLSDPQNGYPKTVHATSQGIPQEGGLFEGSARAYDAIQDAGILTAEDRRNIENTFRIFIGWNVDGLGNGGISNWSVFNLCPAAECALVLQDMDLFNELLNGPTGILDHLRYGTMDDGWWYEMSLSYNLGCAEAFTNLGLAARPFGIDLLNARFPAALTRNVGLRPFEYENFLGMAFGKFGPVKDNTVCIKKMWDGIVIYPDYRGVMFGMGDGHEEVVSGGRFEEAYYAYRDPAYAAIIKQGSQRNLLYGVPDLPADTPRTFAVSGRSDNAGIAVLRSQTANRPQREQIQASFKYGTHGSYHGHFDRLSLNSLMRYGRNFWNPETSWYGYGSYMYKWWVQPSLAHNMVVVDGKQQEPKECQPLLFHSGPMLQAIAAETTTRWSNPPYFGGYEQIEGVKSGDVDWVRVPEDHPKPGELTGYTEPVRQRRLMLVTDDYVIIADNLQGEQEHTFDNLLHLRGAELANVESAQFLGHSAQFDSNPFSSGQFVTNVDRYAVTAPALMHSVHRFAGEERHGQNLETGGINQHSEPGTLQIDAHVLWPHKSEIVIGDYPEAWWGVHKKITFEVLGDNKPLASGAFGAWNLGSGNVDANVAGLKTLQLSTRVVRRSDALKSAFWGNPVLVTAEGKEIPLSQLRISSANVAVNPHAGRDYSGGPVRIAGIPYAQSVAAEPQDASQAAVLTIGLSGLNVVRFKATVGSDWPVGDEEQLRKLTSVRTTGKEAHFLTLIEPYETRSMVKSAVAIDSGTLRVELNDGRVQEIKIANLDGGAAKLAVTLTESRNGTILRTETAGDAQEKRVVTSAGR